MYPLSDGDGNGGCARILVVEDDPASAKLLQVSLGRHGYQVITAENGLTALDTLQRDPYDLVILDRSLPGLDGLEICRRVRARSDVPIVMVTAAGEEVDRVVGLTAGADDYVTKPFSIREVVARVQAVLRRPRQLRRPGSSLRWGDLEMDVEDHVVKVRGAAVELTASEFRLLQAFLQSPQRTWSREDLLGVLYPQMEAVVGDRAVDVHIGNLRKKIGEGSGHPACITTVRGFGYKLA